MLKIEPAPNLEQVEYETYWIGDPAIDRKRSDVKRWLLNGDTGSLKVKKGKEPSVICYRGLDEFELLAVPQFSPTVDARLRWASAMRYGLISIDGVDLRSGRDDTGQRCLRRSEVNRLQTAFHQTIPLWMLIDKWLVERRGRQPSTEKGVEADTGLPIFIGLHILLRSFQRK